MAAKFCFMEVTRGPYEMSKTENECKISFRLAGTARQLLLEGTRGKLPYLTLRRLIFLQNWLEITKKE